jgi:hypothetical protein
MIKKTILGRNHAEVSTLFENKTKLDQTHPSENLRVFKSSPPAYINNGYEAKQYPQYGY